MRAAILTLLSLLSLAPYVASHGLVANLIIDGTTYPGNQPSQNAEPTTPSVIRRISTNDPVKGAMNPNMNCGMNATAASLVAKANAGDQVQLQWQAIGGASWFHTAGPLMAYMASCGSVTCDQFDSTQAKWFKVSEVGLEPGDATWYQANLATSPANVTIPANLAPGNYLIRHEVINLALALSSGGAEFYPSCSQLEISGTGTGAPADNELVSFPGAYSDSDPGILIDVFNGMTGGYTFPGPPVAAFISGDSPGSGSGSGSSSSASVPAPTSSSTSTPAVAPTTASTPASVPTSSAAPTTTTPAATSTGKCRAKLPSSSKKRSAIPPRRHSRHAMHFGSF